MGGNVPHGQVVEIFYRHEGAGDFGKQGEQDDEADAREQNTPDNAPGSQAGPPGRRLPPLGGKPPFSGHRFHKSVLLSHS